MADLMLVDVSGIAATDGRPLDEFAFASQALKEELAGPIRSESLLHPELSSPALSEDQESAATSDHGDSQDRTRLLGIYSGQIQARIDRLWRGPRTPIDDRDDSTADGDKTFQCQVQVVQDQQGNVREILLPNCRGSTAWQRSLILAIQQASPLPAPPDVTVFSPKVTLTFIGYPYVTGQSEDGYEPMVVKMSQVRPRE